MQMCLGHVGIGLLNYKDDLRRLSSKVAARARWSEP